MENPSLIASQTTKTITINGQDYPVIVCRRGQSSHVAQSREARRNTVGVYLPQSERPEPYRMDIETARGLRNQGLADFINRKCDIRLRKPPQLQRSQATIRLSECQANAGLMGTSRTAHLSDQQRAQLVHEGKLKSEEDFIERAQEKVYLWPLVGDTKAVRVGPAFGPRLHL